MAMIVSFAYVLEEAEYLARYFTYPEPALFRSGTRAKGFLHTYFFRFSVILELNLVKLGVLSLLAPHFGLLALLLRGGFQGKRHGFPSLRPLLNEILLFRSSFGLLECYFM